MRSCEFLKPKATIGLIAPSFGCQDEPYRSRLNMAIEHFSKLGYNLKYSNAILFNNVLESAPAKARAQEFMQMWLDEDVDFIFSVAGGEVMMEILPYIDFNKLKNTPPKFFMGFSDNSCLTFTLPILSDAPAIYGPNLPSFGSLNWEPYINQNYDFITGNNLIQKGFDKCQLGKNNTEEGHYLDSLNPDTPNKWKTLDGRKDLQLEGRFIGGCLDILVTLIGTRFDQVKSFIEKYQDEGLVWFMEACDLNVLDQLRAFWQLKEAGWFKYCKGIILGRPLNRESFGDADYEYLLKRALGELGVPVVYDIDIGHIPPSLSIVSGSYSRLQYHDGEGNIEFVRF